MHQVVPVLVVLAAVLVGPATAQQTQHHVYTLQGDPTADNFGIAVTGVGDVNRDGREDLCVGADQARSQAGYVRVYTGATGQAMATVAGSAGDLFGRSVSAAGDVNKDGWPDLLVGAPGQGSVPGYAVVISGLWLATQAGTQVLHKFTGAANGDEYGFSVSDAGDVDKDGYADVLIGARQVANLGQGYAEIRSGQTGKVIYSHAGGTGNTAFGQSVSHAGDANKDGYPDAVIGGGQLFRVMSGKDGSKIHEVTAKGGKCVSGALDVNNDGHDDVMVFQGNSGPQKTVHVFSGKDASIIHSLKAGSASAHTTFQSAVGDINGDGHADVLIHNGGSTLYPVTVYSGKDGTALLVFTGPASFGHAVRGTGDVDGDGLPDVIIGEPGAAKAHVYSTRKLPLATDTHEVLLSLGGTQKMSLDAGTAHANRSYWIFGSITGTKPGTNVSGVLIPLNVDPYTQIALANVNLGFFANFRGSLDASGKTSVSFVIPKLAPTTITLYHAYAVFDTTGIHMASNAVPLNLR